MIFNHVVIIYHIVISQYRCSANKVQFVGKENECRECINTVYFAAGAIVSRIIKYIKV